MKFTLFELWYHMGIGARLIAGTLILMSIASIVIVCERVAVLLTSNKQSVAFAKQLAERGFPPNDGYVRRVTEARDALHDLTVATHYLSLKHGVGRPDRS